MKLLKIVTILLQIATHLQSPFSKEEMSARIRQSIDEDLFTLQSMDKQLHPSFKTPLPSLKSTKTFSPKNRKSSLVSNARGSRKLGLADNETVLKELKSMVDYPPEG